MPEYVQNSLQFHIHELKIVTKAGVSDISSMFEEISIFDSIYKPCIDGKIQIYDSIGFSSKLSFDGSEKLIVKLSKSKDDSSFVEFGRSFRIYKQTDKQVVNQTSERYVLHFVSEEFITSGLTTVNYSYSGSYADAAYNIMINTLGVSPKNIAL